MSLTVFGYMKLITIGVLILLLCINVISNSQERNNIKLMIDHPEFYLMVTDWNYYVARSVFIIKNVRIENSADISYKDIKVKVYQYTTSGPSPGQIVSSTTGVLPVTVPAHSNKTYLKDGFPLGGGTFRYQAKNLQVLGATPSY